MNVRARVPQLAGLVEATALFLFFYQALRVLFSVLFGLIYDALFAETASMASVGLVLGVVLLALLSPLAAPRQPASRRIALLVSAVLVFLVRIPLTLNDPQSRLVASILIVAGTGIYLASRLRDGPRDVVRALILALAADQLLRISGHTWDVTLRAGWLEGQVALSVGLCLLAGVLYRFRFVGEPAISPRFGLALGLAWGGWLFLEASFLNFPNVLARWAGADYWMSVVFVLFFALWVLLVGPPPLIRRGWKEALVWWAGLLAGLALSDQTTGRLALLGGLVAQWCALVILASYCGARCDGKSDRPRAGLALGGVVFLFLSFAHAFTFTYAYTLDLFRGVGLVVALLAGILAGLPLLRVPRITELLPKHTVAHQVARWAVIGLWLVLFLALVLPSLSWQPEPLFEGNSLRIATYNIHYGYDTDWRLSLEAQAQAIEASGADVVMLQEVDAGRPTSYMIDDAYWLAQRLDMDVVFLPTVEHLTGIALLSRFPMLDSETLLLPSELEQTGIIWAELDVGGTPVNAFAIWLGLEPEERARQLDAALPFIAAHPGPAAFGGDFNSTPDSRIYARIASWDFTDPFVALGLGSPPTDPAINPEKRIDFVWLRGLEPLDARVLDSTASDHRLVVVEAALP